MGKTSGWRHRVLQDLLAPTTMDSSFQYSASVSSIASNTRPMRGNFIRIELSHSLVFVLNAIAKFL
jgi:hypothetical protein